MAGPCGFTLVVQSVLDWKFRVLERLGYGQIGSLETVWRSGPNTMHDSSAQVGVEPDPAALLPDLLKVEAAEPRFLDLLTDRLRGKEVAAAFRDAEDQRVIDHVAVETKLIDTIDILIAATALTHSLKIVILNRDHFIRFQNLRMIEL